MDVNRLRPFAVFSDGRGNMYEDRRLFVAGRSGKNFAPLYLDQMVELPAGSELMELPGRHTLGYNRQGHLVSVGHGYASAAFVAPAHTQLALAAWKTLPQAPVLPLYAYTAVGWFRGRYYVPAIRIDPDTRQDCVNFNQRLIVARGHRLLRQYRGNRLVEHIVRNCAFTYMCPAARNFVMSRWEAPIPTSPTCNARCVGCISYQNANESPVPESQHRLSFVPTVDEIVQFVVPHLEHAPRAIASFGQGCEGEPLMQWELLLQAIKAIRARTSRGIINLNTNGSKPQAVEQLFKAGLNSIRVSMSSAQEKWYTLYHRPLGYKMADIVESLQLARRFNRWASINYFVMPGLTDTPDEMEALSKLIDSTKLNMIQWRNLNIDPDWLFSRVEFDERQAIGVQQVMNQIRSKFPWVYFGYFNPPAEVMEQHWQRFNH